jgi:ribosomal protein S18
MYCYFCKRNIDEINFRDVENLQRYISKSGKIKPKKKQVLVQSIKEKYLPLLKELE